MFRLFKLKNQLPNKRNSTFQSAAIISAVVFMSIISFVFLQDQHHIVQEKLQQNGLNIGTYPEFNNISLLFKVIRVLLGIY